MIKLYMIRNATGQTEFSQSRSYILFPMPDEGVFKDRPLSRLFFLFLHIFFRLSPTAKGSLPSVSSRYFWALFTLKMKDSTSFTIHDTDIRPLSKLLIRALDYYYLKDAKRPHYVTLTLPDSEKVVKLRNRDRSLPPPF